MGPLIPGRPQAQSTVSGQTHVGEGETADDVIWTLLLFVKLDGKLLKALRRAGRGWPVLGALHLQGGWQTGNLEADRTAYFGLISEPREHLDSAQPLSLLSYSPKNTPLTHLLYVSTSWNFMYTLIVTFLFQRGNKDCSLPCSLPHSVSP